MRISRAVKSDMKADQSEEQIPDGDTGGYSDRSIQPQPPQPRPRRSVGEYDGEAKPERDNSGSWHAHRQVRGSAL